MHFISALLFGISANIDTFVVGFSYGMKKQHIPFSTNIILSFITFAGTLLSIGLGMKAAALVPAAASQIAGSCLLILLGLYYCGKYIFEKIKSRGAASADLKAQSESLLSQKEIVLLGLTLTSNNAGMGIGASFAGVHFLLTSLITLILCALFLIAGNRIGSRWAPGFIQRFADLFSGLFIIVLGVYELLL